MDKIVFKSTYGLNSGWSYKSEVFRFIPISWRLGVCSIDALKIRIANWTPREDRTASSIFYFDVRTFEEAKIILDSFKGFNFKKLERRFENLYERDSVLGKNTGETRDWLKEIVPVLREEFDFGKG